MRRFLFAAALLLAVPPAYGQQPSEIRVVVGVPPSGAGGLELIRQLNLIEAERRVWAAAIEQLQKRPDVQGLKLSPAQLSAFVAMLVVPQDTAPPKGPVTRDSTQVTLRVPFDAANTARRLTRLRNDPDAAAAVLAAWTEMQALYERVSALGKQRSTGTDANAARIASEQLQQTIRELTVRRLTASATANMARTEPATVGGRVPSAEARERAGRLFEVARALHSDSHYVQSLTGDMLLDAEQPEAAEEFYRKALAGNETPTAHLKLAEVLRLQGKLDAAVLEVREALKLNPASAVAHTDLALILRQQGKEDDSLAEYREAIRLDRDWADAHNGLAVALAGLGRTEQAVEEFREIVRIDPDSTIGYYNLSIALANMDRDNEAAAALREVIRIYPEHYNARYNLGEMFRLEGKYDESAKQFREYVRLAPDTPQNQRNLKRARSYIQQFEN